MVGVKEKTEASALFHFLRTIYYRVLRSLSDVNFIENFTGFGLYDCKVMDIVREIDDPYPYFHDLIPDLGFEWEENYSSTNAIRNYCFFTENTYNIQDTYSLAISMT